MTDQTDQKLEQILAGNNRAVARFKSGATAADRDEAIANLYVFVNGLLSTQAQQTELLGQIVRILKMSGRVLKPEG